MVLEIPVKAPFLFQPASGACALFGNHIHYDKDVRYDPSRFLQAIRPQECGHM